MPKGVYVRKLRPVAERFWEKVDKRGSDECWPWLAYAPTGYGTFVRDGVIWLAHRIAYELATGTAAPDHLCVCHRCDNPPCCNPAHLFLGTRAENNRDMWSKGRAAPNPNAIKTHCKRGHEFSSRNTHVDRHGTRWCRACRCIRERKRRLTAASTRARAIPA